MTTILHKRGTGKPSPDDLKVGEIAIDTLTGTLYTKQSDGSVVEIGGGGGDQVWTVTEPDEYGMRVATFVDQGGDIYADSAPFYISYYNDSQEVSQATVQAKYLYGDKVLGERLEASLKLTSPEIEADTIQAAAVTSGLNVTAGLLVHGIGIKSDEQALELGDGNAIGAGYKDSPTSPNKFNFLVGFNGSVVSQSTIQAKDFLDKDGNSIIGSGGGGGGDSIWTEVPMPDSSVYRWVTLTDQATGDDEYGFRIQYSTAKEDPDNPDPNYPNGPPDFAELRLRRITAKKGDIATVNTINVNAQNVQTIEQQIAGGIQFLGANQERPPELPDEFSPDGKSIQYALTVFHETLGRTVVIDKEGIIRARDFTDLDGNSIVGSGGGGDVDLTGYATETWVSANYQVKGNYLTSNSLNGYATQTWVGQNYQPKGNYLTSFTESDPVFKASPAGTITQTMINNWNAAGSGSTPSLQQVTNVGATTNQTIQAPNFICGTSTYTLGGLASSGARIVSSNGWTFYGPNSASLMSISTAGTITATADVVAYSDVRLKENIETLDGSKVYQMRGVSFTKDGREGSGVIAQELQQIAPELVNEDGEYLAVAYGNLVGYLIEAVKELKAEIEELKK